MIQDGRFNIDEPVSTHFPDFPGGSAITPRLLAAHLGGIPHYGAGSMPSDRRHVWASNALYEFAAARRVGEPGERSVYTTHGITLLSAVMEQRAGLPILTLLQREVFAPFDMRSSGGLFVDSVSPWATRYYERTRDSVRTLQRVRNLSYAWAGAGLLQTPADLVRMTRPYFDGTFTRATLSTAFTEQRTTAGIPTGVAFVWRVENDWRGRPVAHHAGVNPGARAVVLMRRNEHTSVALMTNIEWTASMDRTANMLAEALFNSAPRRVPLRVAGTWVGQLDSADASGAWAINGDTGWVSTPAVLRARFASSGGVTSDRLVLRAIRDDLYALVTPWGLYPFEIVRDASGAVTARAQVSAHRWELRAQRRE
jgi:CubicO group peptidase (beta-lactamase class C family)